MKKILLIPLMMLTMMPMAACDGSNADPILPEQPGQPGNSDGGDEDDSTDPTNPIPGGNGRYLVLYCSRTGSTERMAQQIQQTLCFPRISAIKAYILSYKFMSQGISYAFILRCLALILQQFLQIFIPSPLIFIFICRQ